MTAAEPEPRWLSDAEQRVWRLLLAFLTRLPGALDRQLQRDAGLTHIYYVMLAMLSEAEGRALRMSELARITNTSPSRLSHAMTSLEQRGWVVRRATQSDRRGQLAVLTDEGMRVVVATAPEHVAEVRRLIFDRLAPDELEQLAALMGTLAAAVAETEG